MKNAIKTDVLEGTRVGYGFLRALEQGSAVCSVALNKFESHQNVIMKQKNLLEVFGLDGEIQPNSETEEEAFKSLQRGYCGVIYGSSLSLGKVYLAANSAGYEVDFLPVWISQKEIPIAPSR